MAARPTDTEIEQKMTEFIQLLRNYFATDDQPMSRVILYLGDVQRQLRIANPIPAREVPQARVPPAVRQAEPFVRCAGCPYEEYPIFTRLTCGHFVCRVCVNRLMDVFNPANYDPNAGYVLICPACRQPIRGPIED